jgi:hypothetical protein
MPEQGQAKEVAANHALHLCRDGYDIPVALAMFAVTSAQAAEPTSASAPAAATNA